MRQLLCCHTDGADDMGMTLKLGKRPPDPNKKALLLGPYLRPAEVTPPARRDWLSKITDWPMYANDQYGCCVFAAIGHMIEAWTAYNGTQVQVSTDDLLRAYSDVTGFNPNDPNTDNGTVLQDALKYWRQIGIAGHKILAYARVDHTNPVELKAALDVFGALMIGIEFPRVAMDQFNDGQPWDVARPDGGLEGGHAIHGGSYTDSEYGVVTWGRVQEMTPAFATKYMDEVWAIITPEWYAANGRTPAGIDLAGLGQALSDITGEPNPFPPGPTPPNPPEPPPFQGAWAWLSRLLRRAVTLLFG